MKKELQDEEDVRLLVRTFYNKVLNDQLIGPFFDHARKHHWEKHMEVMDKFWCNIIFFTGDYTGNPLEVHLTMHHFKPLSKDKFDRWVNLFCYTVDKLFTGPKAELAKRRAKAIAEVMQIKILTPDP
jgi:hemoglobin